VLGNVSGKNARSKYKRETSLGGASDARNGSGTSRSIREELRIRSLLKPCGDGKESEACPGWEYVSIR